MDRLKQAMEIRTPQRKTSESPARENTLLPNSKKVERILDYYMDDDNSQPYDSDNVSYSDIYDADVARRLDAEELGEGDYDDDYEDDFHSASQSTTLSDPQATHDDGDVTTIASKYTDKTPSHVSYDSPYGSSGAYGDDDSSLTDTEYSTIKKKRKETLHLFTEDLGAIVNHITKLNVMFSPLKTILINYHNQKLTQ